MLKATYARVPTMDIYSDAKPHSDSEKCQMQHFSQHGEFDQGRACEHNHNGQCKQRRFRILFATLFVSGILLLALLALAACMNMDMGTGIGEGLGLLKRADGDGSTSSFTRDKCELRSISPSQPRVVLVANIY
jgi:hypothetical protein